MVTDSDFANNLFLRCSINSGSCSAPLGLRERPTNPFRVGASSPLCDLLGRLGTAVRGVPGDVGGRARGAELIEWAPRLCECVLGCEGPASGVRVFVNVIVTENGSPAKYDDCEGVTTTRTAESISPDVRPGMSVMPGVGYVAIRVQRGPYTGPQVSSEVFRPDSFVPVLWTAFRVQTYR